MSSRAGSGLNGYLVIDKPAGWTSFDVVARARRLLGERKIGHAGTLDPAATGVLPLAVGTATKTLEYLSSASKAYLAEVVFGIETDSYDIDGRLIRQSDPGDITPERLEAVLVTFRGEQTQIPPMHSAVKIGGQRLYDLARRGEEIVRTPRPVVFHRLDLRAWEPPVATIWIDCSKGTYIRTLAKDLGDALGCGAHLGNLVRYRTGPFHLCEAWTMTDLADSALPEAWPDIALHPDAVIQDLPALLLDAGEAIAWRQGKTILTAAPAEGECRAYAEDGEWLGIGRAEPDARGWHPAKVVPGAAA